PFPTLIHAADGNAEVRGVRSRQTGAPRRPQWAAMETDWRELRDRLIEEARGRGWAAAGVASVRPMRQARERGLRALAEGWMEGMPWFTAERVEASTDLGGRYPWARSSLALAWPYAPAAEPGQPVVVPSGEPGHPRGRMSAYACLAPEDGDGGSDYHDVLAKRCDELVAWLRDMVPELQA